MARDEWYLDQFQKTINLEIERRLHRAGKETVARLKKNIGTPTATNGPSRPGAFPHADTYELQQGIGYYVSGSELVFYSRAPHTMHIEIGTSKSAARPFFRRTILGQMSGRISAILTSGK